MSSKVLCIVGPTACGKTRLSIELAKLYHGEILSADSMQIYQGMPVATAAPTIPEMQGIPHHMIGVASPVERWSVARYVQMATPVLENILARGKLPILTGGTGLWMNALIHGTDFAPGDADSPVRKQLQAEVSRVGLAGLYEELSRVDPDAAGKISPADEKRILRALEVYRATGKTISAYQQESKSRPVRYRPVWIGLRYENRQDMWMRIDQRVDYMVEKGLLDEAREMFTRRLPPDTTAMQAIGIKEFITCPGVNPYAEAVSAAHPDKNLTTEAEAISAVKLHTRQYAKRQLTWLRRNPDIYWIVWKKEQNFIVALQNSTEFLMATGVC